MSLAGSLSGIQTSVAWRVIGADGPSSLVTGMGVPDYARTEGLSMSGNVVAHFAHPGPCPPGWHGLAPFPGLERGFGHDVDDEPTHLLS